MIVIDQPWGKVEWKGAWSDESNKWTNEWK
jgi:hypothetical protein